VSTDTLNYGAAVCHGSVSIRQHGDAAEQIFVSKNSAENLSHVANEAATMKQLTTPFGIKMSMCNAPVEFWCDGQPQWWLLCLPKARGDGQASVCRRAIKCTQKSCIAQTLNSPPLGTFSCLNLEWLHDGCPHH